MCNIRNSQGTYRDITNSLTLCRFSLYFSKLSYWLILAIAGWGEWQLLSLKNNDEHGQVKNNQECIEHSRTQLKVTIIWEAFMLETLLNMVQEMRSPVMLLSLPHSSPHKPSGRWGSSRARFCQVSPASFSTSQEKLTWLTWWCRCWWKYHLRGRWVTMPMASVWGCGDVWDKHMPAQGHLNTWQDREKSQVSHSPDRPGAHAQTQRPKGPSGK